MYAKSKAFRNLVIVLAVLLVLGAGLVLVKNLSAQGIIGSGDQSDNPGVSIYGDPSDGNAATEMTISKSDGGESESDGESTE